MNTFSFIDLANYTIVISAITIALLGMMLTFRAEFMDSWTRRYFIRLFSVLLLYESSNLVSQISLEFLGKEYGSLSWLAVFSESFFSSLLMLMLTAYILHACGESYKSRLFIINSALWTVYVAMLISTWFTTYIWYVSDDNIYYRGPLYSMLLVPTTLIMLINLSGLYLRREFFSQKETLAFVSYILIPMLAMLLQMASYGLMLIILGTATASLIMFSFILNYQAAKAIRSATELAEQQYRIRALLIRPHFIYNTLTNIYYLCERDPRKAQTAIGDFTVYLRNNFSAVIKQGLIPFDDELKHTQAYLAVVKMRYDDLLFVEYDTEYTSFYLPPLTLEPIAENAVKHGLDPEASPLHVLIRTREKDEFSELTVENSGMDFSLNDYNEPSSPNDDEVHIGLNNVTERLKALCEGTLSITPREGGGTVVTIRIPFSVNGTSDGQSEAYIPDRTI